MVTASNYCRKPSVDIQDAIEDYAGGVFNDGYKDCLVQDLKDPDVADSNCTYASFGFGDVLVAMGIPAQFADFSRSHYENHVAVLVGGFIVDFAYRQYDAKSDWPLVRELMDYEAETGFRLRYAEDVASE